MIPIQPEVQLPMPALCHASPASTSDHLNADNTHEEVGAALKRPKQRQPAGFDCVEAEFVLDAADLLVSPVVLTSNQILDESISPLLLVHWSLSSNLQGPRQL